MSPRPKIDIQNRKVFIFQRKSHSLVMNLQKYEKIFNLEKRCSWLVDSFSKVKLSEFDPLSKMIAHPCLNSLSFISI